MIFQKKLLGMLCLFLLIITQIQGYYVFNRRNHPELDWQQVESENVIIVYHDPLFDTAREALKVAESAYNSLTRSYDLELDRKVKIFISNQDDITNGFSMGGRYIAIYVDVNDYVNIFTGRESWLRKVISHEMSHHFVFHSIRSWIDMFLPVTALTFPNDFNEGYAMFLSGEKWGYGRSDASLRRAVYSNKMDYNYNDGFYYTTGFSMVRYLYEFYGIEKLQELLKYRNELGIYNFKKAFKKVYNKSLKEFKEEWRKHVYTYYYGTGYELKKLDDSDSTHNMTLNSLQQIKIEGWNKIENININDSALVLQGKATKSQNYRELVWGSFNPDTLVLDTLRIEKINKFEKLLRPQHIDISPNSRFVSFVRYTRYEHGSIRPTVYRYDKQLDKIRKIVQGDMAQINNKGQLFFQRMTQDHNYIKKWNDDNEVEDYLVFEKSKIGQIKLSPDNRSLAITRFDENKNFLFEIYKHRKLIYQREFERMPRDVMWTGGKGVLVTVPSSKDSRVKLYKYSMSDQMWTKFQSPPFNFHPVYEENTDSTHKLMVMAQLDRTERKLGKINLTQEDPEKFKSYHQNNYYNRWIRTQNPHKIILADTVPEITNQENYLPIKDTRPFITLPLPDEEGFTLVSSWMDPLMKHNFTFAGYLPYSGKDPYYFFNYMNGSFKPALNFTYARYDWIGGIWEEKLFYQDVESFGISANFPVNFIDAPFYRLGLRTGVNYQKVSQKEKSFQQQPIFEDGKAVVVGGNVNFIYNLPYDNSYYHPVRQFKLSYGLAGANKQLGMLKDFTDHNLQLDLGFALLYDVFGQRIDNFILKNKTTIEWLNGDYLAQYRPGIDTHENIPVAGGIISDRRYIRGVEQTITGDRLFITKNEFWTKIADDFRMSLIFGLPLLDLKYTAIGGWFDYGKLWNGNSSATYQTMGYEFKGVLHILNLPTIQRFGKAFDLEGNSKGYYYQVEIPFLQNIY